jgi:2-iminobutanoate/2-iminopropanoate deaminase
VGVPMKREVIRIPMPPGRVMPVSRGTKFGNLIFTSGMTARDLKTGKLVEGDMATLARATLENIKAIVEAGGASLKDVMSVTCYLADIDRDFAGWNDV